MNNTAAAVIVAAVTGGVLALLPKVADIRSAGPGDEIAHDLHTGLFVGAVVLVALAAIASFESKSAGPLLAAGVAVAAVVGAYEWVLRTDGIRIGR